MSSTVKRHAERIAREIESGSYATRAPDDGHGIDFDGADDDEEALFASVPRALGEEDYWKSCSWSGGWGDGGEWCDDGGQYDPTGHADGGAAGAIMAMIAPGTGDAASASGTASGSGGQGSGRAGSRSQVVSEVQNW